MAKRLIHIVLASLVLIQSMSAVGATPVAAAEQPVAVDHGLPLDESTAGTAPCHGGEDAPAAVGHSCCDTMDDADCVLHCASAVSALTCHPPPSLAKVHFRHPVDGGYVHPTYIPAERYRPPRLS